MARRRLDLPAGLVTLALLGACGPGEAEPGDVPPGPTAAPATPARAEQQLEARVTAEVFSGRPNPEWILSPVQSEELSQRMGFLSVTAAGPPPQGLGYRGLVVRVDATNSVGAASLRVYGNTIYYTIEDLETGVPSTTALNDASASFEDWLLSTGRPHMDPESFAAIEAAVAEARGEADAPSDFGASDAPATPGEDGSVGADGEPTGQPAADSTPSIEPPAAPTATPEG